MSQAFALVLHAPNLLHLTSAADTSTLFSFSDKFASNSRVFLTVLVTAGLFVAWASVYSDAKLFTNANKAHMQFVFRFLVDLLHNAYVCNVHVFRAHKRRCSADDVPCRI